MISLKQLLPLLLGPHLEHPEAHQASHPENGVTEGVANHNIAQTQHPDCWLRWHHLVSRHASCVESSSTDVQSSCSCFIYFLMFVAPTILCTCLQTLAHPICTAMSSTKRCLASLAHGQIFKWSKGVTKTESDVEMNESHYNDRHH